MIVQGSRRRRVQRVGVRMLHWSVSDGGPGRRSMSIKKRHQYGMNIGIVERFICREGILQARTSRTKIIMPISMESR